MENFFTASFKTRGRFPRCLCDVIAFPFDVVLVTTASSLMVEDRLDFPSFLIIVDVWGQSGEVGAVNLCFGVRH